MDLLPPEIVDKIILNLLSAEDRAGCRNLRQTCRRFARMLKPYVCQTVSLGFRQLDKSGIRPRPRPDALQTVGTACKVVSIDMSLVRDEEELEMMPELAHGWGYKFHEAEARQYIRRHLMGEHSFTEAEYRRTLEQILLSCDSTNTLRLALPRPMLPTPVHAPTRIFANTMAAYAALARDDNGEVPERPLHLETLIIENLSDKVCKDIHQNHIDLRQARDVFESVRNLVITLRLRNVVSPVDQFVRFERDFWRLVMSATNLESLCIAGTDPSLDSVNPGVVKVHPYDNVYASFDAWNNRPLPAPGLQLFGEPLRHVMPCLTRLEIKGMTIHVQLMEGLRDSVGHTLRELYLNHVYLHHQHDEIMHPVHVPTLWVGVPNRRPGNRASGRWIANVLREGFPELEIVRATHLGYDIGWNIDRISNAQYEALKALALDREDPCGLGRSIAQRFVEVVLGYAQPNAPPETNPDAADAAEAACTPILFYPSDPSLDGRFLSGLKPRPPGGLRIEDYDVTAYQLDVHNRTSSWLRSPDGTFPTVSARFDDPEFHGLFDKLQGHISSGLAISIYHMEYVKRMLRQADPQSGPFPYGIPPSIWESVLARERAELLIADPHEGNTADDAIL